LNRALAPTFDRLRRIGLGERMLKTAFAAGLAYWLGSHVPHVQSPYLAPIVAILVMQLTIADSVTSALQRLVAVMIGAPLAFVVAAVFGVNPLTVALMVLVSFVVGARFSLNAQGLPQVAITALLVMLVGSPHVGYALSRVAETAIGGIVGILVNALVAPPSYLPRAEAQVAAFGSALAAGLDRLANDVERGLTPAAADERLAEFRAAAGRDAAATAVAQAEASLRYNYFRRDAPAAIQRWSELYRALDHTERQARSMARSIRDAVASDSLPPWLQSGPAAAFAGLLRGNAELIRATVALAGAPNDPAAADRFREALAAAKGRQAVLLRDGQAPRADGGSTQGWLALGSALAELDRMSDDLAAFAADARPAPKSAL
jgi:uncharacterized membrane protein YgaE (UPF0421/DUF939 family)